MNSMFFITGATGGLGKAFAAECASRGLDLFLTDLQEENLAMLAQGLGRSYGIRVLYHAANLTEATSRTQMFDRIRREGWKFRGLLNVAGLDHEGLFYERSREEISAIVRLNVEATLIMTHTLLDFKDPVIPFRIVNVSSLAAFFSMPVKATYAASKRFLLDFSLALREELVGLGIAPDRVDTLSYGEDNPVASGHNEDAWAQNRRADLVCFVNGLPLGLIELKNAADEDATKNGFSARLVEFDENEPDRQPLLDITASNDVPTEELRSSSLNV